MRTTPSYPSYFYLIFFIAFNAFAAPSFKTEELRLLKGHIGDQRAWPTANSQREVWQSFLQTGTIEIQYTPMYGHTSQNNITEVVTVTLHPADYPVDWQLLMDFDLTAAAAWDSAIACANGDSNQATEAYFSGRLCKGAVEKIISLKESLLSLGTFQLRPMLPTRIRACKSKINSSENCRYLADEITKAQNIRNSRKSPLHLLSQIEQNFPRPTLHPFLIQLLLEQVSIDDPTAKVMRLGGGGLFSRSSGYMHIEFPYFHNVYGSALEDIIQTGTISPDTNAMAKTMNQPLASEQDPILFQMRRSYVMMNLIMLSHTSPARDCNLWGLTPALTHRLLEAKRRSSSHTINAVERIHEAISRSCGLPIETTHFHFFMNQSEMANAAMVLGVNDVWKTMAGNYFQSPTSEAVLWKNGRF